MIERRASAVVAYVEALTALQASPSSASSAFRGVASAWFVSPDGCCPCDEITARQRRIPIKAMFCVRADFMEVGNPHLSVCHRASLILLYYQGTYATFFFLKEHHFLFKAFIIDIVTNEIEITIMFLIFEQFQALMFLS